MPPLFWRKRVVQVKLEATKGTAETTGLTDLLCFDPVMNPADSFEQRKGTGLYLGSTEVGMFGARLGTFTCQAELRGNGTNAMDAALSVMFEGCGLNNTSETYQVHSTHAVQETVTIHLYEDGVRKVLYGAMGNFSLEGEFGGRVFVNFEFTGIWGAPTDVALPAYTPSTEIPPKLESGTFTIAAAAKKISKFGLDMGNVIVPRADVAAAGGLAYALITDNDPVISFDPEADTIANHDFYGIRLAGTEAAVVLVLGSGAGKEITITCPKVQYRDVAEGDREGIIVYEINGGCNHSSGNDSVSIAVKTS